MTINGVTISCDWYDLQYNTQLLARTFGRNPIVIFDEGKNNIIDSANIDDDSLISIGEDLCMMLRFTNTKTKLSV
jgi:hypothetical protein